MKFKVTYPSGLVEWIHHEKMEIEAFINSHFGSTWGSAKESGATVEAHEDDHPETAPAAASETETSAAVADSEDAAPATTEVAASEPDAASEPEKRE